MTELEAISIIHREMEDMYYEDSEKAAFTMACMALNEKIPMYVREDYKGSHCPCCEKIIRTTHVKFCSGCGQALKWR